MNKWTYYGYGNTCRNSRDLMPYSVIGIELPRPLADLYLSYRANRELVRIAGLREDDDALPARIEEYRHNFNCREIPVLSIFSEDIADEDLVLAKLLEGEAE